MEPFARRLRRWRRRRAPKAVVLLYHRVTSLPRDPLGLAVPPERFAEQIAELARRFHPVPLAAVRRRRRPDRAVAVTFDDGYADNLVEALPILERHRVPATVFVTTAWVAGSVEPWWDELDRRITGGEGRAPVLELTLAGEALRLAVAAPAERRAACDTLQARLVHASAEEREAALAAVRAWEGGAPDGGSPLLTVDQLRELAAHPLIEIGAHTRTHLCLSRLPPAAQHREIAGSKADLEGWLGRRVTSFAYPYGTRSAYTATTVGVARRAGFATAWVNMPGSVTRLDSPYELRRCAVERWEGAELGRRLAGWLE